jgi:hypothetical protein
MKRTSVFLTLAVVLLLSFSLVPTAGPVFAQPTTGLLTDMPVVGDLAGGGTFDGVLSITGFAFENGELLVSGVLEGTTTQNGVVTEIIQTFTDIGSILSGEGAGACDILFLNLGPLFLDLLGLTVDLSEIELDVNAVPGAGNLLGNLLCAVVGLLDNGGPLAGITNLLNRINNLLG